MKKIIYLSLLIPVTSMALESMDDSELGRTTGEGIGVIVENLSIDGLKEGFDLTLNLDKNGNDKLVLSNFNLYKTGTAAGTSSSGGNFGTVNDPVSVGDLLSIPIYSGNVNSPTDKGYTATTAMRAKFPGSEIKQIDRSTNRQVSDASGYAEDVSDFNSRLYSITDKFNIDLTIDSIFLAPNDIGPNATRSPGKFNADLNITGFATYGTRSDIFAVSNNGFAMAGSTGLFIDSVKLSSNSFAVKEGTGGAASLTNSSITFNGIDINTVLGTADQPLTLKTELDENGKSRVVLEIGYLPASKGIAPKSDITVKSIYFGDKNNPALKTGADTYAFQPKVGNTMEIIGLSIQHLKITTLDI